jgi:hypothetical protein
VPQRKHRRDADRAEPRLAIGAHVLQKQIAEHHVRHAGSLGLRHRGRHLALVDFIRARIRDAHDDARKAAGRKLHP